MSSLHSSVFKDLHRALKVQGHRRSQRPREGTSPSPAINHATAASTRLNVAPSEREPQKSRPRISPGAAELLRFGLELVSRPLDPMTRWRRGKSWSPTGTWGSCRPQRTDCGASASALGTSVLGYEVVLLTSLCRGRTALYLGAMCPSTEAASTPNWLSFAECGGRSILLAISDKPKSHSPWARDLDEVWAN